MGEVYRATDGRLGREVAIKIIADTFAQDGDRLARFQREAKTLASLNHPNIAGIYGLEEISAQGAMSESRTALVMELVEGEDLSDQIRHGRMALADVLPIAKQIASALEAAHEQGIIHRDLKPGNVKVRSDGTVKVLDFGLAKVVEAAEGSGGTERRVTESPTLTARATQMGMILGTAAYMAPEQARGKVVDKRADVWAFGAVLFEMLAGARAFPGEDITDTLAAVVRGEPDWSRLPSDVPPTLRAYLRRCLEKDPKQRVPDMATMRLALDGAFDTMAAPVSTAVVPPRQSRLPLALLSGALVVVAGVAAYALVKGSAPVQGLPTRLTIPLPPGSEITSNPAITRDGRTVAYVAQRGTDDSQLYLRDLGSFESHAVAGASGARQPFFSPDGKWVAFFAQGYLQKAEVAGGAPVRIAEAAYPFGGTWLEDNTIIYTASLGSGLLQVSASGGVVKPLTKPDADLKGYAHTYPQALPGERVLYTIWGGKQGQAVLSLKSGESEPVMPTTTFSVAIVDESYARLLVVDNASGLRAAAFDPANPAPTSLGETVLDNVYYDLETESKPWFVTSRNGTAVYAPGNPAKTSLVWVGRDGTIEPATKVQDMYREATISPDGTKAVVRRGAQLWIHDLERGTSTPLTSGQGVNVLPVWSLDSRRIVFASNRLGDWEIYSQPTDPTAPAEVVLKRPSDQFPYAFAPDGTLLYTEIGPKTGRDLWTLSPDGKPSPVRVTQFNEFAAVFSPGPAGAPRSIAYCSDESGRNEIYVQTYPGASNRVMVSNGGGVRPMWSRDGKELFFLTGDALVSVTLQANGTFSAPHRWFDRSDYFINNRFHSYDVSLDGKRVLMIHRDPGSAPRQLNVILNWGASGR
jgi:serine/threonine-protein kinase